jgi:hypothetical protein
MIYAGNISGNKPHHRKYNVEGGVTCLAGVAIQSNADIANQSGVIPQTVEVCIGCLGVASADAASTLAQSGTTANNVNQVATIINPDAIWRTKLSAGAAEDVALVFCSAAQVANAAGDTITGAIDANMVWGYEGANAGLGMAGARMCDAAASVLLCMPYPIAALDTFLYCNFGVATRTTHFPQFTTNLTQANMQAGLVDANNINFTAIDFLLRDSSEEGRTNSFAFLISTAHAFGPGAT